MKIVQYLEELGLVLNVVCETIEKEAKEKKGAFMGILLGVLGASLLGNMLVGKGVIKRGDGIIRASEETNRSGRIFNATSSFD